MILALFIALFAQPTLAAETVSPDELRRSLLLSIMCVEDGATGEPASGAIDFVPGENLPNITFNRYAPKGPEAFFDKGRIETASIEQDGGRRVLKLLLNGQSEGRAVSAYLTFETPTPKPHEIKLKLEPVGGKPIAFECIPVPPMASAGQKQ